ncbi:hypothetical protein NDU88_004720 [Pleurodeles waltl]|uniref:Uncharacterized protein n=1 Tax=Pleurodeles waltl TaxID=8319 RepID=A0AAV7W9R1_PLEWA|nr:hypothetical protein NDU88_004720 [Pleurodeles waltl]
MAFFVRPPIDSDKRGGCPEQMRGPPFFPELVAAVCGTGRGQWRRPSEGGHPVSPILLILSSRGLSCTERFIFCASQSVPWDRGDAADDQATTRACKPTPSATAAQGEFRGTRRGVCKHSQTGTVCTRRFNLFRGPGRGLQTPRSHGAGDLPHK